MTKYQVVGCEFYDELLEIIRAKEVVQIDYQDEQRNIFKLFAKPVDVITRNKEEFLILENEPEIRLDYLHKVGNAISNIVLDQGNSCGG